MLRMDTGDAAGEEHGKALPSFWDIPLHCGQPDTHTTAPEATEHSATLSRHARYCQLSDAFFVVHRLAKQTADPLTCSNTLVA